MPIDPSIAMSGQQVNPMQSLASVVGLANGIQNFKQQQQQIDMNAIKLREQQNLVPFLQDPSNYSDGNGQIDHAKLYNGVMKLAPTTGAERIQQFEQAQQAQTVAKSQILALGDEKRGVLGRLMYGVDPDKPELVNKMFDVAKAVNPEASDALDYGLKLYNSAPPEQRGDIMKQIAMTVLPQQTQQSMATPEGVTVNTGQKTYAVNVKPGASVAQGAVIPGTGAQMQLPPTTPVFNQETQQPGYLGAQGSSPSGYANGSKSAADTERLSILQQERQKAAKAGNTEDVAAVDREINRIKKGSGFVASGPALGQAENVQNNVSEMNRHYGALQDQASGAQLALGLTSNIKQLANSAITGTEAGRKSYVIGLLNALHIGNQATGDLQKDTDLLEKNLAQLNLSTPAASDAARTLVSAARPHSTMQPEAIKEAADQLAGQIKANVAIRNMLTPYKMMGDVNGYTAARQKLESIADPRAFQFHSYNHDDQVQMLKKMSPQDRLELRSKIQQLDQMGMFK